MSGLYTSLQSAVSALGAHSRAVETAGKNLANVNNPRYARQRVTLGDMTTVQTPTGPAGLGLRALGIEQLRDALLDRQVLREISLSNGFQSEQQAYQRAQAALSQGVNRAAGAGSAGEAGIGAAVDELFTGFQQFAANPTDLGTRQVLLQRAATLTERLQLADTRLTQVQGDLNDQIATDVSATNRLLTSIAELNTQIGRTEVTAPGSAVDLRDQRQAALEQLAARLPIEVRSTDASQVEIIARDSSGGEVSLVQLGTVTASVAFDGAQFTAGTPPTALGLSSGSLQGALTARDGAIQTLRDNLDSLARQLVVSVNTAYNPTGATGDFFAAAGVTAATIRVAPGLTASSLKASDGGAAGENTIAIAVAALASRSFATASGDFIDGTFATHFAKSVSELGQSLATANARVEEQGSVEKLVRAQRDALSGVSLDEEMADLMKFQRAFQASSRVFTVIDELLETVISGLGR